MSNFDPAEVIVEDTVVPVDTDEQVRVDSVNDSEATDDRLVSVHYVYTLLISFIYTISVLQDLPDWHRCDDSTSSFVPTSTPTSPGVLDEFPRPRKKRKARDEVDEALVQLSKSAVQRRQLKEKREAEKQAVVRNLEINYGLEVAETLNRLTVRQRALAKLKIQQLLFEIEFPSDA